MTPKIWKLKQQPRKQNYIRYVTFIGTFRPDIFLSGELKRHISNNCRTLCILKILGSEVTETPKSLNVYKNIKSYQHDDKNGISLISSHKLKRNAYLLCLCNPKKIRHLMNLQHIFLYNSKNRNYKHILRSGTDNCDSNLSKNIQL